MSPSIFLVMFLKFRTVYSIYEATLPECVNLDVMDCEDYRELFEPQFNPQGPIYIIERKHCQTDLNKQQVTCGWNVTEEDKFPLCFQTSCLPLNHFEDQDICGSHFTLGGSGSFGGSGLPLIEYQITDSPHCTLQRGEEVIQGARAGCCVKGFNEEFLDSTNGVETNEFPHQALLLVRNPESGTSSCGGTVYNRRWIITASHCIMQDKSSVQEGKVYHFSVPHSPEYMEVYLGSDTFGRGELYKVERVEPHQNYSRLLPQLDSNLPFFNDIALLKLNREIQFSEKVKGLRIAPVDFNPRDYSDYAVIIGWGRVQNFAAPMTLKKTNIPIWEDATCSQDVQLANFGFKENAQQLICFGGTVNNTYHPTAGQGDSGGPAICRDKNGDAVLCGVTSFATLYHVCIDQDFCIPSVYADVSFFRKWIRSIAGKQDSKTFHQVKLYGRDATIREYLNQVHITSRSGRPCGGTLVSKNKVVTSAHCVLEDDGVQRKDIRLAVSLTDLTSLNSTPTSPGINPSSNNLYKALAISAHPDFQWTPAPVGNSTSKRNDVSTVVIQQFYKNDIAVVTLDREVRPEVHPALFPPTEGFELEGDAVEVSWRLDSSHWPQKQLRDFSVLNQTLCQSRLDRLANIDRGDELRNAAVRKAVQLSPKLFCGVEKYSGGSVCDRELGGGLFCRGNDGLEYFCGVQTVRLCTFSIPNMFLDVRAYREFIERNL